MKSKRLLGLIVLSVLAISAASATAAQAAPPEFHFQQVPATITASGTGDAFTTSVGKLKCSKPALFGVHTTSTTTTTMTLTPEYEGCTFLGLETAVETNGCYYVLHLVEGSSPPTATMDIVCPKEKEITFKASGCVVHIPPQTGLSHVVFENLVIEGGPGHIQAAVTVTGIKYTLTAGCPGVSKDLTLNSGEYHA